ncbi:hypothetical protein J2S25_000356 [Mesobacillus stamsii]|uniref:Uncharacterized protein n=1 Tax=Mesobacillus stamsii TaxID=225347 RepID=A0ABU0FQJ2_9BACI|nr:hypothetical protein [Mesobacillus stamsii]
MVLLLQTLLTIKLLVLLLSPLHLIAQTKLLLSLKLTLTNTLELVQLR